MGDHPRSAIPHCSKKKKNHFGPFEKYQSLNIKLFGQDD